MHRPLEGSGTFAMDCIWRWQISASAAGEGGAAGAATERGARPTPEPVTSRACVMTHSSKPPAVCTVERPRVVPDRLAERESRRAAVSGRRLAAACAAQTAAAASRGWLAAVCAVMTAATLTAGPAAGQSRSVWDGVYTEAQAERGRGRYRALCGYCHRDDLSGGGSEAGAPALRGPFFLNQWRDRPLVDLFVTIGTTMPQQNPDSLRAQVVIDIVSYLLRQNGAPAGGAELPPRLEPLRSIVLSRQPAR